MSNCHSNYTKSMTFDIFDVVCDVLIANVNSETMHPLMKIQKLTESSS